MKRIIITLLVVVILCGVWLVCKRQEDYQNAKGQLGSLSRMEFEVLDNIVSPAYIVAFTTIDGIERVHLDFVTRVTAYQYAKYRIEHNDCLLPNMSQPEALDYARDKLLSYSSDGEYRDIGLFKDYCIDGFVSMEFGESINQSPRIVDLPLSDAVRVINGCHAVSTLDSMRSQVEQSRNNNSYHYNIYNTSGYYVPEITVQNGHVVLFDFVTGCAG